jgi:hypothetical protein
MKQGPRILLCLALSIFAVSCGLEDPPYSEPINSSDVTRISNYQVSFNLPENGGAVRMDFQSDSTPSISISGDSLSNFFSYYNIYYKIYISGSNNSSPNTSTYTEINSQWYTDYAFFLPLTVSTDTSMVNSRFINDKKYFRVNASSGPPLLRANELINPEPDRNFFYSADLVDPSYISTNYNADVMANSTAGSTSYAWAAMYVVHKKFNETTLTEYYSAPTFLGIFLLPNTVNSQPISVSSVSRVDGSTSSPTTKIQFTLSQVLNGLSAAPRGSVGNASINDSNPPSALDVNTASGVALSSSGTTYTLQVTNGAPSTHLITRNTVTLLLNRSGYSFNPSNFNVEVYVTPKSVTSAPYPINIVSATPTPASGVTTGIVLTLNPQLYGLTPTDIILKDNSGTVVPDTDYTVAASGASGATWTLTLSTPVATAGTYTVTINNYTAVQSVAVRGP